MENIHRKLNIVVGPVLKIKTDFRSFVAERFQILALMYMSHNFNHTYIPSRYFEVCSFTWNIK